MAQTSREVVKNTLGFERPDRIARQLWVLPWASNHYPDQLAVIQQKYPDDFIGPPNVYRPSPITKGDPCVVGDYIDEWGCVFENVQAGIIGEVKKPIISDIADLSALRPPYDTLPEDPVAARDIVNRFCDETDRFVIAGCCPRPWERMQFLRGTVDSMMDIMAPETGAKVLLDTIHNYYLKELEFWASTNVDGLMFMDDWGSQLNLLIPPAIWVDIFKPMYKDYCDIAHANNQFAFMHSDGQIIEIYPHLIEIGLDAINSQIFCMDMDALAKVAKGKITLWGELDRQHLLSEGTSEDVIQAVNQVFDYFYADGGVIAQMEFGPGANPENVMTAFEEWDKLSTLKKQ